MVTATATTAADADGGSSTTMVTATAMTAADGDGDSNNGGGADVGA